MINHFNRIAPVPNVKLVTAYVNELPHILAVVRFRVCVCVSGGGCDCLHVCDPYLYKDWTHWHIPAQAYIDTSTSVCCAPHLNNTK